MKMNIESLRTYCLSKAFAKEDLPFGEHALAFKVKGKIFALTGLDSVERKVNLKCEPDFAIQLRANYPEWIEPGYHMNKKHWNTVHYENLNEDFIRELIDHSYQQVVNKLPKKEQADIKNTK